jgi:hypothetical protein
MRSCFTYTIGDCQIEILSENRVHLLFAAWVIRRRIILYQSFECHAHFLRQPLGAQIAQFTSGLDSSEPDIPKSELQKGFQRLRGQPSSAVTRSDVAIHLSTESLDNDMREATVAHDRIRFPQLQSPWADAPLAVLPKAIGKKFLRLNFSASRYWDVFPSDDVFEIFSIDLAQNKALCLEHWHPQHLLSQAHANNAANPAPQSLHNRPAPKEICLIFQGHS